MIAPHSNGKLTHDQPGCMLCHCARFGRSLTSRKLKTPSFDGFTLQTARISSQCTCIAALRKSSQEQQVSTLFTRPSFWSLYGSNSNAGRSISTSAAADLATSSIALKDYDAQQIQVAPSQEVATLEYPSHYVNDRWQLKLVGIHAIWDVCFMSSPQYQSSVI